MLFADTHYWIFFVLNNYTDTSSLIVVQHWTYYFATKQLVGPKVSVIGVFFPHWFPECVFPCHYPIFIASFVYVYYIFTLTGLLSKFLWSTCWVLVLGASCIRTAKTVSLVFHWGIILVEMSSFKALVYLLGLCCYIALFWYSIVMVRHTS